MIRATLSAVAVFAICSCLAAQPCPQSGQVFWSNDFLPQNPPAVPVGVSIIQGLCANESCGTIFTMPTGLVPQRLTQVVCPFGSPGGANGALALVNLRVYDGVGTAGATPNMGTLIFDLNQQTGNDMQVMSHGLNTLDVTQYNIVVGNDPSNPRFAVTFTMNLNPNGTCASGHPSNFFTDNSAPPNPFSGCNPAITLPATNLIQILGQGWRFAETATVTGIPLCPIYYAGNWVIRACSENAPPANPFQITAITPLPATSPGSIALQFDAPGFDTYPYVAAASLSTTPPIPTPSGNIPLAADVLFNFSLTPAGSSVFVNFTGTFGTGGTAIALINVPAGITGGLNFYVAFVGLAPGSSSWAISDPALLSVN